MPGQTILPYLPCPECRMRNLVGKHRIGNNRGRGCRTCNNWTMNVRRLTLRELARDFPDEYQRARNKVEADLYPWVCEDWIIEHPASGPKLVRTAPPRRRRKAIQPT